MVGVVLAFLSSTLWGASDFVAGVSARRAGALRASLWSYLAATGASALAYLWAAGTFSTAALLGGLIAAVCSAVGFVTFYASLALAPMGVATAIVAAGEVVIPVIVGVGVHRNDLTLVGWLGIVATAAGAIIVSAAEGGRGRAAAKAVVLAITAGASFGLSVVALDAAPSDSGLLAPLLEVAGGLVITAGLILLTRLSSAVRRFTVIIGAAASPGPRDAGFAPGFAAGVLQAAANIVLMYALWNGQLAVVGVIVCLYPLTTVLLARILLKETLTPVHLAGIGLALTGCALLAVP